MEEQYVEPLVVDEVWVLVGGELTQIAGGEGEDDDSEERQ